MENACRGLPTHQLSLFGSSCPYFLTMFTLCRSRGVKYILIGPQGSFVAGLIITLSEFVQCFSGLRVFSLITAPSIFRAPCLVGRVDGMTPFHG